LDKFFRVGLTHGIDNLRHYQITERPTHGQPGKILKSEFFEKSDYFLKIRLKN